MRARAQRRVTSAVRVFAAAAAAVGLLAASRGLIAQDRPLPDLPTLLQETREHLRDDWRLERQYTYVERRTEYARGDDGREQVKSVKVFDVVPSPVGGFYRRLVEVDGRRLSPQELERNDKEHQRRIADRQRESATERQRRIDRQASRRREEQEMWDDLARVYDFTIVGREPLDGESLVVVDFRPKPAPQPRTDNGRMMTKVKGRVWVAEDAYQVVRIDAQVLDDISVGWGLIGKLYAGAQGSYVRCKAADGGEWLPQQLSYSASGRALIRRFAVHQVIDYFNYHKAQ